MAIGDTITEPIPAVGTAGTTYASQLVAFLTEVKARLEAHVPMSSLLISLLDMANNAVTNLSYAGLYQRSTVPTTPVGSLQRYESNLYWISASGAVRLTDGAALDATSIGGFTGDYGGANPAQARFVDADKEFYFYDDYAGLAWAYTAQRAVDIYGGLTSTNRVRISWAGSANPNYTLTLPATVPAATAAVQMDTSGNLTAATTASLNLTSTARVITGNRSFNLTIPHGEAIFTGGTIGRGSGVPGSVVDASTTVWYPIQVAGPGYAGAGDVKLVSLLVTSLSSGTNNTVYSLVTDNGAGAFTADIGGSPVTSTSNGVTLTPTTPVSIHTTGNVWLKVVTAAGSTRTFLHVTPTLAIS